MNTTTDTAAAFTPNAVYSVPSLSIYYDIEWSANRFNARIRDTSGFISGWLDIGEGLIDPDGYAIPVVHTSNLFHCSVCGEDKTHPADSCSTGYASSDSGKKTCFDCMGKRDTIELLDMKPGQRWALYMTVKDGIRRVSNWPGTFSRPVDCLRISRHNWGLKRYDVWFTVQGERFHGYQIGDNTDICHVRKLKPAPVRRLS